jgi:hypothetical protein
MFLPAPRRRVVVGLLLATALLFVVFVCTAPGQRFDDAAKLLGATHELSRRLRRDGLPTLKHLSSLLAAGAVFSVIVAVSLWQARKPLRGLAGALLVAVPPVAIAEALKFVLPRPHLLSVPGYLELPTFPSGHVAVVAGCALAVFVCAPPSKRGVIATLAAAAVTVQVILVVAGARHRPSDAVAAVLLTLVWGLIGGVTRDSAEPVVVTVPPRLGVGVITAALGCAALALVAAPANSIPTRSSSSRCVAVASLWALVAGIEFARVLLVHLGTARVVTDEQTRELPTHRRRSRG